MRYHDEVSLVLAGEAGQGIQSLETMVARLAKGAGFHVFATKEYQSRVRGGVNSTELRISSRPVSAFVDRIDLLVPLTREGLSHLESRRGPTTTLLDLPFADLAAEVGAGLYASTLVVGLLAALLGIPEAAGLAFLGTFFAAKGESVVSGNHKAFGAGYARGLGLREDLVIDLAPDPAVAEAIMVNGAEAFSLGALAGGCTYVCAYPMSPGTSVLTTMAGHSRDFDLLVEQVEDEIGVANMAIGAWYAGARALTTTSGGGFALMGEAVSLSGALETPFVAHIAQRPGPATGLPTRTEQGDLELAVHAGHGDFLRIVLAPGDLSEGFALGREAFDLADHFQSPAVVLTDQYFVDSYYDTPTFDAGAGPSRPDLVVPDKDYLRYALGQPGSPGYEGLSPRALPGTGPGLVCVDSDEHDESGHITEDPALRKAMVEKRLAKIEAYRRQVPGPRRYGPAAARRTVVAWGSTKPALLEALARLEARGIGSLALYHFTHVHPLPLDLGALLPPDMEILVVEGNPTGQFADLLGAALGRPLSRRLLKYDGYQFSVEELELALEAFAKEGS